MARTASKTACTASRVPAQLWRWPARGGDGLHGFGDGSNGFEGGLHRSAVVSLGAYGIRWTCAEGLLWDGHEMGDGGGDQRRQDSGVFGPDDSCTRVQAVTFLYRAK